MNFLAVSRPNPDCHAALNEQLCNGCFEADFHSCLLAGLCHQLCDPAHATNHMAPLALLAIDLAKHMMKQNIGAARRIGARIIADNGVKTESRLDRLAFKPLVEQHAGAEREQLDDMMLVERR